MGNTNFPNSRIYSGHYFPVLIDFNFIVDATDSAGYGVKSLKGAYVKNVYMNTSVSPAVTGFNPAAGQIAVQLTDNYNGLLSYSVSDKSPLTLSDVAINSTSLTPGQAYVISVLGTSVAADWSAIGIPAGITPAVGVAFICIKSGNGAGSGKVQLALATGSGIIRYDSYGTPNTSLAPLGTIYSTAVTGGWMYFRALGATDADTTTLVAKAPAVGTRIFIRALLSNTSLQLGGQ